MEMSAISIRSGNILLYSDDNSAPQLWIVAGTPKHTKPGKGGAYVQVEMKNILTGIKMNRRFSSSDTVVRAHLEQKPYQYLYEEGDTFVFMDNETFEQINLSKDILGESGVFLEPSMVVKVEFFEDRALSVDLPANVVCEIVETEPVIKGATATATYKPAILQNGIRVMVPQYIEQGQKIVVKTEDMSFVERAK